MEKFIEAEEINSDDYSNMKPTVKGLMAANIHEIHPLACIDMITGVD